MIEFKSIPEYYLKESTDQKNNTIRRIDYSDERFQSLLEFSEAGVYPRIKIVNKETGECFIRRLQDITWWDEYVILTWKPLILEDEKDVYSYLR